MDDLLPCPFCGSTDIEIVAGIDDENTMVGHVTCMDCGASSGWWEDKETAIERWNTRHYSPEVEKAVERMKPKKPERRLDGWNCPICEMFQTHEWEVDQPPFCWNCGQALDWEV